VALRYITFSVTAAIGWILVYFKTLHKVTVSTETVVIETLSINHAMLTVTHTEQEYLDTRL